MKGIAMSPAATVLLILSMAVACAQRAHATSYAPPTRRDVFSPNGMFVLDVNPEVSTQSVYRVEDKSKPIWTFEHGVSWQRFFLSNDGLVVCQVAWENVRIQQYDSPAVSFIGRGGSFQSYTYRELCPRPYTTEEDFGPIGDFWRVWLHRTAQAGSSVDVRTVDGNLYQFEITTGRMVSHVNVDWAPKRHWCGTSEDRCGIWEILIAVVVILTVSFRRRVRLFC